jgi:hypothetical protein
MPAAVQEPFYLAEIVDNDIIDEVLTVRWYAPTNTSKSRTQNFHQMNYEIELCAVGQSKGRQNGQVSIISIIISKSDLICMYKNIYSSYFRHATEWNSVLTPLITALAILASQNLKELGV